MIGAEPSAWTRLTEPSIVLSFLTLVTMIAGWLWKAHIDGRDRRWAKEDRERLAAEQLKAAGITHAKLDENNALAQVTNNKLDENTQISTEAFHEANTVNNKIQKLGESMVQHQKEAFEKSKRQFEEGRDRTNKEPKQ